MEVCLLSSQNVPEDAIISIRSGAVRRQGAVSSNNNKPFCFPKNAFETDCVVKVDIMKTIGSGYLVVKPNQTDSKQYQVVMGDNPDMVCEIAVQPTIGTASSVPEAQDESAIAAKTTDAKEYMESTGLLQFVQGVLQVVIKQQPDDPYIAMAKHFLSGRDGSACVRSSIVSYTQEAKPAEVKSAEAKPAEEKSAVQQPAEESPTQEKPAEKVPIAKADVEEKPAEEKPAEEAPIAKVEEEDAQPASASPEAVGGKDDAALPEEVLEDSKSDTPRELASTLQGAALAQDAREDDGAAEVIGGNARPSVEGALEEQLQDSAEEKAQEAPASQAAVAEEQQKSSEEAVAAAEHGVVMRPTSKRVQQPKGQQSREWVIEVPKPDESVASTAENDKGGE